MKLEYQGTKPTQARPSDAGYDLRANLDKPVKIYAGEQLTIPLGTRLAIPHGFAGMVIPRSGLAAKHSLTITNTPGLIDPGYRGEIMAIIRNHGRKEFMVSPNDRVAQLVIVKVEHPEMVEVADLGFSDRGANGLGSSGTQ